jgi:Cd2+/Zn2+-exporting ATPase
MSTTAEPLRLRIEGMDCADCALTIEKAVGGLDGIDQVTVSLTTATLEASGRIDRAIVTRCIEDLGYGVAADANVPPTDEDGDVPGALRLLQFVWREPANKIALLLAGGLMTLLGATLLGATGLGPLTRALELATVAIVGLPIALHGVRAALFARRISIDLLIALATAGAVGIGAFGEAAAVILLFSLGETLEGYCAERSRDALRGLVALRPNIAQRVSRAGEPGQGPPEPVPVEALLPGDCVLARPGERIPADGRIVEGRSSVDAAALTGESVPQARGSGDDVFAGTINGDGLLRIEVSRVAADFSIAQIARLVADAQSRRSVAERHVDRFATWYTPAVVLIAVAVAAIPPLLLGQPFLGSTADAPGWAYRGLALLIVACPCALVISIPVTVVSALARLARLGVLVKGGALLQALAETDVFAFDKTGTLTLGEPVISATRSTECAHAAEAAPDCEPCDELLAVAAAVESGSEHPYARAVVTAARARALDGRYPLAEAITAMPGRGIVGSLGDRRIAVGSPDAFGHDCGAADTDCASPAGRSVVLISENGRLKGHLYVEDTVRPTTRATLDALRAMRPDYRFVMLTGDRRDVASRIADSIGGFDEVRAELMPADKLDAVRELGQQHGHVAMIGDGINDAPALAAARLGIAMGGAGSHQAMETADIVLMRDDLTQLPTAVAISRKTQRVIRENVVLSVGLKLIFLALAVPGLATLWMAVLADVGATVLVTLNGMRLLRAR